jgi:hypothetical protein
LSGGEGSHGDPVPRATETPKKEFNVGISTLIRVRNEQMLNGPDDIAFS